MPTGIIAYADFNCKMQKIDFYRLAEQPVIGVADYSVVQS